LVISVIDNKHDYLLYYMIDTYDTYMMY